MPVGPSYGLRASATASRTRASCVGVLFGQHARKDSDVRGELGGLVDAGQPRRCEWARHAVSAPASLHPALARIPSVRSGLAKANGPGASGSRGRLRRQQWAGGLQGDGEPAIVRRADARRRRAAVRLVALPRAGWQTRRLGPQKNMTPKRENNRSASRPPSKVVSGGVGNDQPCAFVRPAPAIRSRARAAIGSETSKPKTSPGGTQAMRQRQHRGAATAADVDRAFARFRGRGLQRDERYSGSNDASRRSWNAVHVTAPPYRSNTRDLGRVVLFAGGSGHGMPSGFGDAAMPHPIGSLRMAHGRK